MANQEELSNLTELLFETHSNLTVWKSLSAASSNLSPPQINTLEIIGHNYSLRMKELAAKLGVTTGTLTVMVDRLEKKDLVCRKTSENDRRSIMVYLTGKGRETFLLRYRQQLEFIKKTLKSLDDTDRKVLSLSLHKILRMIQDDIR